MKPFSFLDPYASFFGNSQRLIDPSGKVLFDADAVDWSDASTVTYDLAGLHELGTAASRFLADAVISPETWEEAHRTHQAMMRDKRAMLHELSRTGTGIAYVDEGGRRLPKGYVPDWEEQSDPEILNAFIELVRTANEAVLTPHVNALLAGSYAFAAMEAIDSAALGVLFPDAGGTINPMIIATRCVANAETVAAGRSQLLSVAAIMDRDRRRREANRQNAKKPRQSHVDHDEIWHEFKRLVQQGHTERNAKGLLKQRGLASTATIWRSINEMKKRFSSDR